MVGGESRESECLRIFDEGLFTNPVGTRKCTDTGRTGKKIIFSSLKKKRNLTPYYGVAASIAVLLIVTLFFFIRG